MRSSSGVRGRRPAGVLAFVAAIATALLSGPAVASGRWYAWLDRLPHAAAPAAEASYRMRGVPAVRLPSERVLGVEAGFDYLIVADCVFKADAEDWVARLQGGGFKKAGLQYFSDALAPGLEDVLGGEPVFAVDAELDGVAPAEIVALTRGADGDLIRVLRRHADNSLSVEASHATFLYGLPKVTEGERATALPLVPGGPGTAVVFEAAFQDARQAAVWSLVFAYTRPDPRAAPKVFFVPGARSPVPTRVRFEAAPEGLKYTVQVEGLPGGVRTREMVWREDRFVDARGLKP